MRTGWAFIHFVGALLAVAQATRLAALHAALHEPAPDEEPLSGVPYRRSTPGQNVVRRIEFVTVTVDDLMRVGHWYTEVMGAKEIDFCKGIPKSQHCDHGSFVHFSGHGHQEALFGSDVNQVHDRPDISDDGKHEAVSRFFVLGNSVVQLLMFQSRETDTESSKPFVLVEPRTSPVWMGQAHIDFWIEEGIDANTYIREVETLSADMHMDEVKFNRPVRQESLKDRQGVHESNFANKVQAVGNPFDGLAWAYFKGPIGEQYEFYQTDREIKRGIGRAFCERGAVSGAFVRNPSEKKKLSQQLHGVFQYGYRTAALHRAVGFYAEVLGGDLITYPTQGSEIMLDDSAHWMILANETLGAYEYAKKHKITRKEAMKIFAVPDISKRGTNRLDHRFILFDNFVVEPLQYTDGLSFGGDGFNPELGHGSSPAYIGTVLASFGIEEKTEWSSYLSEFNKRLVRQGYRNVKAPTKIADFSEDHPYHGLEYGYFKGPDGEAIALTRITGRFREVLHEALLEAGGVSTMFKDTNPYEKGEMADFCHSVA